MHVCSYLKRLEMGCAYHPIFIHHRHYWNYSESSCPLNVVKTLNYKFISETQSYLIHRKA